MGKDRSSCRLDCVRPLETLLRERGKEIAALIIEPLVMAAGGMIIYPPEYLAKVRELTGKFNVHCIVDEVATGFGRTGTMFACEQADIQPDFMCLSKGITSGYLPLGVTLTTKRVFEAFYADYNLKKTFYHGHTYTANPLACAAANACLDIFQEQATLKAVKPLITMLRAGIEDMRSLDYVGDVRSAGMIGAIELVKDKRKKTPFSFKERIGLAVYKNGLKKNLLLRPLGNIVYFFLPLGVTRDELALILERSREVLCETLA
jgi:adenosylmethionine-8-amino-7-oxononanoate aminotransferase apoenzyme (EC 2.6.1.62)